jgi:alanine racemase
VSALKKGLAKHGSGWYDETRLLFRLNTLRRHGFDGLERRMHDLSPVRAWIEIDLDALSANYRAACALAEPARVAAVLKADAYGLGAVRVARRLAELGADFFAVSSVREGLELRRAGLAGEVLVMGLAEPAWTDRALAGRLTLTADSLPGAARVVVRGARAPVLGPVCMDQMMADVTDAPGVEVGDVAELLGGGVSLEEYAAWADTNRNEALTRLTRRPLRIYRQAGRVAAIDDALAR